MKLTFKCNICGYQKTYSFPDSVSLSFENMVGESVFNECAECKGTTRQIIRYENEEIIVEEVGECGTE
ncbi:TPA_asm: hypothetical protein vir520_00018 [Caudoviricetes sp. vir520]|nr:TPA_asm: hypothetical protein vir520_00018 [Caudoviricetes sp. vir520]